MTWTSNVLVYVTHTGRPIVYHPYTHRAHCGGMVVDTEDLHAKTAGQARQMRRMIAKAKRRARRESAGEVEVAWKKPPV